MCRLLTADLPEGLQGKETKLVLPEGVVTEGVGEVARIKRSCAFSVVFTGQYATDRGSGKIHTISI